MRWAAFSLMLLATPAMGAVTHNSVDLRWTAVGDDSLTGTATSYDIRYATFPITAANFGTATSWSGVKLPASPGTIENLTVTGLAPSTQYWFAVKTLDEVPNISAISNVITRTTLAPPDTTRPAPIPNLTSP
jgi:chitodextrinase